MFYLAKGGEVKFDDYTLTLKPDSIITNEVYKGKYDDDTLNMSESFNRTWSITKEQYHKLKSNKPITIEGGNVSWEWRFKVTRDMVQRVEKRTMTKKEVKFAKGGEVDLDAISKNPPYAVAIDMYGEGDPDDIFVGFYKDNSRYGGGRSYYGRGADKNVRWSMKDVFNDGYEPKIFQTIEDYRAWKKSGSKMAKGGKTRKNTNK